MPTVVKSPQKKKSKKGEWRELKIRKPEFQELVRILNRFYSQSLDYVKSPSFQFREELCLQNPDDLGIFVQKFGTYEFLIYVTIKSGDSEKKDSWIHIDGVRQERDELLKIGKNNHPVFQLVCMSDLYDIAESVDPVI